MSEPYHIKLRKMLRVWDSPELPGVLANMEKRAKALVTDLDLGEIKFKKEFRAYGGIVDSCYIDFKSDRFWELMQHPMFEIFDVKSGFILIELIEKLYGESVYCKLHVSVKLPDEVIYTLRSLGKIETVYPETRAYEALACF